MMLGEKSCSFLLGVVGGIGVGAEEGVRSIGGFDFKEPAVGEGGFVDESGVVEEGFVNFGDGTADGGVDVRG